MHVVLQQLAVVICHLLEVRHDPVLVDRIAMKAAGEMVVDPALRHLDQRQACRLLPRIRQRDRSQPTHRNRCLRAARRQIDQQVHRAGMGKLRLRPKAAVAHVHALQGRDRHLLHQLRPGSPLCPEKASLCSIAFITLPADSLTSVRRFTNASAIVSRTR